MFRNMVTSLFEHGRIRTTDAKAKELRRWADRMITLAKRGDHHARRQALAVMRDKTVVHKLFEEVVDRFGDRAGGYTNVIKVGRRRGDAAPISLVELVAPKEKKEPKKKASRTTKKVDDKARKEPAKQVAPEMEKEASPELEGKQENEAAKAGPGGTESQDAQETEKKQ